MKAGRNKCRGCDSSRSSQGIPGCGPAAHAGAKETQLLGAISVKKIDDGIQVGQQPAAAQFAQDATRLPMTAEVKGGKGPTTAGATFFKGLRLLAITNRAESMQEDDREVSLFRAIGPLPLQPDAGRNIQADSF